MKILNKVNASISKAWFPLMMPHGVKRLDLGITPSERCGGAVYRVTAHISGRGPITQKKLVHADIVQGLSKQSDAEQILIKNSQFRELCGLLYRRVSR